MSKDKIQKNSDGPSMLSSMISGGEPREVLDMREVGATGLKRFSGFIYEEFLPELTGWKGIAVYKEMASNDATVGAVLFAIKMLCRRVKWMTEPASSSGPDLEAAEFLETCMNDMSQTWIDTINEILSMLEYGHCVEEIVYKRRCGDSLDPSMRSDYADGRVGWRKLSIRSADTLYRWQFDDHGGIQGVEQLAPPHYYHVTIPVEKFLLFRTTTEKNNPEGKSILRSAYRCFSEDTDILTDSGWKAAGQVSREDKVATLNPATNAIEYQHPSKTWSYEHTGEMIMAQGRFVDQLVTPNHRMWVRRAASKTFEFIEAQDCTPTVNFKTTADWNAERQKTFEIAGHTIDANLWYAFMGIWLAEGHCGGGPGRGYEVGLTQKTGETKDWIKTVLDQLPWHFAECDAKGNDVVTFRCYRKELWEVLSPCGKEKTKTVPRYLLEGSKIQLEIFLRAYHLGDGTNSGSYDKYPGTDLIFTSSEAMADDLMEAAFKASYRPTKRWKEPSGFGGGVWSVVLGKDFAQVRAEWSAVEYHGLVHCVTTQNGIVYCRRNGKSSWSGNSWYMKKNIENIEAIGVERDLAGLPIAWVPPEILSPNASDKEKALLSAIRDLTVNVRRNAQEGMIMPMDYDENGKPRFEFKLLSTGGSRQFDTTGIINRYDQRIAMSALADFILLGQDKVGSFALASSKTNLFSTAIGAFMDIIADVFNRYAVPRLFKLNDFTAISGYPKIKHGDLGSVDLNELGNYVQKLSMSGLPLFPNPDLEKHLLEIAGLPPPPEPDTGHAPAVEQTATNAAPPQLQIPATPEQHPTTGPEHPDQTPVADQPPVARTTTEEDPQFTARSTYQKRGRKP